MAAPPLPRGSSSPSDSPSHVPVTSSQKIDIIDNPPSAHLPGSCALRLSNLHNYSSNTKKRLMRSIATDIKTAFICIAHQARAGNLTTAQTAPVNEVVRIIKDTDVAERRRLENKVACYRRQARRWKMRRQKMQSMQGQLRKIGSKVDKIVGAWKERLDTAEEELERVRGELEAARNECDLLKQMAKRGMKTGIEAFDKPSS